MFQLLAVVSWPLRLRENLGLLIGSLAQTKPVRLRLPLRGDRGASSGGPVVELVGIEGGVVSGVFNLESSGVEAPDRRPRHEEHYHEA